MDETSLRAQLELAVSDEPPLGPIVGNALRKGRRLRRQRRAAGAAALSAVAIVLVSAVPALTAAASHQASRPGPVVAGPAAEGGTAYVAINQNEVVPVSLSTNTAGTPIRVPDSIPDPSITSAAVTPNGRTIYEVGSNVGNGTPLTPIDTATDTAGPAIGLGDVGTVHGLAVMPDGHFAYLSATGGLFRISTATDTASKVADCSRYGCGAMAVTPDGRTLYVIDIVALNAARTVTVIRTASNAVLTRITLPVAETGRSSPVSIAVTPDSKTAYVVDGSYNGQPGASSVVPISVATNTALAPIKIQAAGDADGLVLAPDGRTAYVLSGHAVTPIDTATNQAEPAISLPPAAGDAYDMALTPDGRTLYVLAPHGVIPISTSSDTALPTIKVPGLCATETDIAITPDGRTVYVGACITRTGTQGGQKLPVTVGGGVVPISTTTNTAGHFINLGQQPIAITFTR